MLLQILQHDDLHLYKLRFLFQCGFYDDTWSLSEDEDTS